VGCGVNDDLITSSALAWIYSNGFVTENRKPIEFTDHRFLIDYISDQHPHKTSKKSSQIGETVIELLDDFHLAIHRKLNVIHTLHTNDVLKGFVVPKVNPIIQHNPGINMHITKDSEGLKQFKDNFVYFRGANAESQAISISADVLKIDEKDRSNLHVVEMFQSRLDFSEYKWIREFSNPSAIGFGVDETYNRSDQRHWFRQVSPL
jgi:phage terminase large subunit GpA-like protein